MFDLIKKLTQISGNSGNEEGIREILVESIKDKVDEIKVDALGNLIAIKKGTGKKILIAAHMDEIGIMVTHIDEKGFLRFSNLGGVSPFNAIGQRVQFTNGTIGVVNKEQKFEDMKSLKLSNLFVDIGATSREEAKKLVNIGDVAVFMGEAHLQGDLVISKALDDRAGCAVLVEAINQLPKTDNEIYFAFTVQEEIGTRGAKTVAYNFDVDMAIAIDVTATGDTPESRLMEVKMGYGPAIKIKDNSILCHRDVIRLMEDKAKAANIPYQFEILEFGGTDVGSIHITKDGIPSGAISIPTRHIHSPSECVSLKDMENVVKLLVECIK